METQVLTQPKTKHSLGNPDVTQSFSHLPRVLVFYTPLFTSCAVSYDSFILMW